MTDWKEFVEDFFADYEKSTEQHPLEKRHHPACPTKMSTENKCRCRELYDADYEGDPLR